MMTMQTSVGAALFAVTALLAFGAGAAQKEASPQARIERDSRNTLKQLVARVPAAKALQKDAIAILVFPSITKVGLMVGGQYGEGALFRNGQVAGFYDTKGASYGMQAGAQKFGYAMFFMTESALAQLEKREGFEVGVGPSVVVMDEGMAKSTTTTTARSDVYAFIYGQKGLMAGAGIQGNKITRLDR